MDQSPQSHREQLFARLAIQVGFLTSDQLNSVREKGGSESIAVALVESGVITTKRKAILDDLVEEHLNDNSSSEASSLLNDTVSLDVDNTDATLDFAKPSPSVTALASHEFAGYEILEPIGKGGMGVVYKARQKKLNRIVALKMIKTGELADDHEVERFKAEAEAAANLDHPGIVPVYEVGESQGQNFFSMGFVEGRTLSELLRDGPLEPRRAAEIVRQISDAMTHAHSNQIIHRDLKPANILMDDQGRPRITDFGLAKQMADASELTATGQVLGTPSYMPPEQAAGNETGPAADIYALGAILYATITGRPPHQAASPTETLLAVLHQEPAAPRVVNNQIPKDLETICLKCLNKEPAKRYATAEDATNDLNRWLANEPIAARRVGRLEKSWLWCKRRPVVAGLVAALFLVVTIGSLASWERSNAQHARALLDSLGKAEPSQAAGYLDQIEDFSWWTKPLLEARYAVAQPDSKEKVYLGLAMLRFDDDEVPTLKESLLVKDPRNFALVRDALAPYSDQIVKELWQEFRDADNDDRRLFAGLALAKYADDDEKWTADDAEFLVDMLLNQIPEDQPIYRSFLVGIKERLYKDLKKAFLDTHAKERRTIGAAKAFAEFARDDIRYIADVAAEATVDQWEVLYSAIESSTSKEIQATLLPTVRQLPSKELSPTERVTLGRRRAGAAIALLRKGDRIAIFDALRVAHDPESLTQFVHRCKDRGVVPADLLECLDIADKLRQDESGNEREVEDRALFGILLALGEFPLSAIPDSQSLITRLADWYATDPSAAIHGATGWLLRHWGQDPIARKIDQTPIPYSPDRQWYTLEVKATSMDTFLSPPKEKTTFLTFVVVPAGTYEIGAKDDEPQRESGEDRHQVTIDSPFAVLDREVTWAEAAMFNQQMASGMRMAVQKQHGWSPGPNEPWVIPTWYDSVRFCRWLTERVGLSEEEQAYPDPASLDRSKFPADPHPLASGLPKHWPMETGRPGFRLLTEAEWEVACRAGTSSVWSFGGDAKLLEQYAWFVGNSDKHAHPARLKRPNLRGLFDMHGNVLEWCHDWYASYPGAPGKDLGKPPATDSLRVIRGGSWYGLGRLCRSSSRSYNNPALRYTFMGFRIAATLPNDAQAATK